MTIETKELVISNELKRKVDMICRFAFDNSDDIFINGYKKKIRFKDFEEYIKTLNNSF